jgi:transcriptional regulator with XRE-family HTH domain
MLKGISQEKLAELAGLHRTYLGGVERGERNPTLLTVAKIARGLNVPMTQLLDAIDVSHLVCSDEMV